MTSMAWDAMEMGIDPVCGPDGRPWEESNYKRPGINREIFGDNNDGDETGKIDIDRSHGAEYKINEDLKEEGATGDPLFDDDRQIAIIDWLCSSILAKKIKSREGFFVTKGPQVCLRDGEPRDLFEWLFSEGIEDKCMIGSFSVYYTKPGGHCGERFSFFKDVIKAPFDTLPDKSNPDPSFYDEDIPF